MLFNVLLTASFSLRLANCNTEYLLKITCLTIVVDIIFCTKSGIVEFTTVPVIRYHHSGLVHHFQSNTLISQDFKWLRFVCVCDSWSIYPNELQQLQNLLRIKLHYLLNQNRVCSCKTITKYKSEKVMYSTVFVILV